MTVWHCLSDFVSATDSYRDTPPTYWYEGYCSRQQRSLRLPRTALAEAIAYGLMQHLDQTPDSAREGKMYGVLLVATPTGKTRVLKAFSGLLNGHSVISGWVPPIPGRDQIALTEALTIKALDAMKQELINLQTLPERHQYDHLAATFTQRLQALAARHHQRQQHRQQERQQLTATLIGDALTAALTQLDNQSRRDGMERRQLKRERAVALAPLQARLDRANAQIRSLKQQRQERSRQLQAEMHAHYQLTNFAGESQPLPALFPGGLPTGTGDCCAPKLLHYAATHGLRPLALAEFWWGPPTPNGEKIQGEFYGACAERCQPLMGFLLSGLTPPTAQPEQPLPILYEDEWLIAVNKPAGLLSVPGRYHDRQDSVLTRCLLPSNASCLLPVHRLDQDTSGILLLAKDRLTHRQLQSQFQQRQVHKVYEALLAGYLEQAHGVIELPLWGNPRDRPRQRVDWQHGKPSLTQFQVIAHAERITRVIFTPLTGRTHQLRVHAADTAGLGMPILGDRLYGCTATVDRLHLHARELTLIHPHLGESLSLQTPTPF